MDRSSHEPQTSRCSADHDAAGCLGQEARTPIGQGILHRCASASSSHVLAAVPLVAPRRVPSHAGGRGSSGASGRLGSQPAPGRRALRDRRHDVCRLRRRRREIHAACYEQAFGNLAYRTSAKQALGETVTRGAKITEISADCHRIAHTIGAAVLAREEGDVSVALVEGDSTCWSGFYHGLLERALAPARSTGELGRLIRDLCDPRGKNWPAFTHYQCLHGIGHGLMLRTGYQRDVSLDLCTRLPDAWSRQSCDGGVFMEGFSPSLGDEPPPWDPAKPLEPCPSVAEKHKLYCYLQVADNLVRGTNYDWRRSRPPVRPRRSNRVARYCFQGFGRQASGNNYGRPAEVARLCVFAGKGLGESDCVYGAVRDIASQAASGTPAATFCRKVSDPSAQSASRGWARSSPRSRRRSRRSGRAARRCSGNRNDCVRGAGLTVSPSRSRGAGGFFALSSSPTSASRISCCGPVTVSRTSLTPRPSDRATPGAFAGPTTSSITPTRTTISHMPRPKGMRRRVDDHSSRGRAGTTERRCSGLPARRGSGTALRRIEPMESALLAWYRASARDLPWRRTRDPYAILVSEVMLQQTQVDRVVPRYVRWLERWPTRRSACGRLSGRGDPRVAGPRLQPPRAQPPPRRQPDRASTAGRTT